MRKLLLLLLIVTVVVTAANLHLVRVIDTQRDMYARDTALAYNAGVKHGIEQAVDSSPDVEALTTLFSRYPAIDDPEHYARCVVLSSARHRVPMVVLAGMVLQESSGNPDARSSCGAVGLTQIRWRYWGETLKDAGICEKESDLLEPETSIEAGAYILRTLIDTHGDIDGALRHYSGNARGYTDKVIGRVVG
jgi:hypothetical protein